MYALVNQVTSSSIVTCQRTSHYPNQYCFIVDWVLGNKLQWLLNHGITIFIQENELSYVACTIPSLFLLQSGNILCRTIWTYGNSEVHAKNNDIIHRTIEPCDLSLDALYSILSLGPCFHQVLRSPHDRATEGPEHWHIEFYWLTSSEIFAKFLIHQYNCSESNVMRSKGCWNIDCDVKFFSPIPMLNFQWSTVLSWEQFIKCGWGS